MLLLQDDDDNVYTSIQELRDEADELQHAMEECEMNGDAVQYEQLQQKFQQTKSKLLEKNEQRDLVRYFKVLISHSFCLLVCYFVVTTVHTVSVGIF